MKIEISTEFDTSHTANYRTRIKSKIVNNAGVTLCEGESTDSWPNPDECRASAREATREALARFEHLLDNARDVAKKAGLA